MARSVAARLSATLFACVALGALGGAVMPAEDGAVRLAALEPPEPVMTASLGAAAVKPPEPPPQPPVDIAVLKTAIEFYRRGDVAGGDAVARAITHPPARALLEWLAIRFDPREVGLERIQRFTTDNPDWPMQASMRRRAEEALVASRPDHAAVRSFFRKAPPATAWGRILLAKALVDENRMAEAAALVRTTWREGEFGSETETRIIESFPELIEAADHRARAVRLLYDEDWIAAQRAAARVGPDWVRLAKVRMAAARLAPDTLAQLDALPKALQTDPVVAFSRANYLRRTDKPVEAGRVLTGVSRDPQGLGNPEAWWTERRVLARKLLDLGEQRLAYEVVRAAPAGGLTASRIDAEFHAGWIALRFLADTGAARQHFAEAGRLATTPISMARAAYWQGRAAEAAGLPADEAYRRAAAHPTTWYGQLSRARLGWRELPVRRVLRGELTLHGMLPPLQAVRLLYEAEVRDLAMPLLADLALRLDDPAEIDALAAIPAGANDARALLVVGKTASQRGLPVDDHAFPLIGVPRFDEPARSVEKALVWAIARQESAFDPKAVSSAGARGLMQLMPATARQTAVRAGLGYAADRLTTDPSYNAQLGASHLGELMGDWKGSYVLAIAAYNAGGGNVRRWIEAFGDPRSSAIDPVDWIERIPFSETRNYVQRVMENLQVYRTRLGDTAELLIEADLKRGVSR